MSGRSTARSTFRSPAISSLHADGNWSKSDDLETGGHILSEDLREQALASPDPGHPGACRPEGRAAQFGGEVRRKARWASAYVDGDLNVGVSVTRHLSKYEVPIRYSLDPAGRGRKRRPSTSSRPAMTRGPKSRSAASSARSAPAAAMPNIIMTSWKRTGAIGSTFFSKGGEGRLELVQADHGGWGGTSGVQYLNRNAQDPRRGEIPARQPARSRPACSRCRPTSRARCGSRAARGSSSAN